MQIIRLIEKELFVNFLSASQVLTALPCRRNSQRNHRLFFKNWKKKIGAEFEWHGAYLSGETFDQNGHQQVEEDVIAERHQRHKVEGGPVARLLHAVEQDDVPVFLR